MKFLNKQKNINSTTKTQHKTWCRGFTLIETMVAVIILSTSVIALLSLTTNSLFTARYSNNEITSNYLLQEVVDYIRNDRDTTAFQKNSTSGAIAWNDFLSHYGTNGSTMCYVTDTGCTIEVARQLKTKDGIASCPGVGNCLVLRYDPNATNDEFYTYKVDGNSTPTTFRRTISMELKNGVYPNSEELIVNVTVSWMNGNLPKSKSLAVSFLSWQVYNN